MTYIREFGDHGESLELRYWVKEPYYVPRVRSAIQERIWADLPDADVELAYPHAHLVFDETSGTARVAVDRSTGEEDQSRDGQSGTG